MLKQLRVNNQIRIPEVQVIDDEGVQLGVMSTFDALKKAQEKGLDLVEVGPNVRPPIAKIMDYGKYIYRKEKQEKQSQVKHKEVDNKTVRIGFKTGVHDLEVKARQIDEFLSEGRLIKLELTLRGREKALADMGKRKLNDFLEYIKEEFSIQEAIKRSPYGWVIILKKAKNV